MRDGSLTKIPVDVGPTLHLLLFEFLGDSDSSEYLSHESISEI